MDKKVKVKSDLGAIEKLLMAELEKKQEPEPEQKPEKQPRKEYDCFDCPYLRDVGRAYYCMFFKIMKCPQGYGVPSIWEYYKTGRMPKETRAEETEKELVVIRPPFPDPIPRLKEPTTTTQSLTSLYHREIYEWRYEEGWSWKDIAEHLGCTVGYIREYVHQTNKFWKWSWNDVLYKKPEK